MVKGVRIPELHIRSHDFTALDLEGRTLTLKGLRGKPILLDFMYTRCRMCWKEGKVLREIYQRYGDRVTLISIDIDTDRDSEEDLRSFAEEMGYKWHIVLDTSRVRDRFGVTNAPATIIIDGEGFIRYRWVGLSTVEEISHRLDRLLRGN